MLALRLQLLSSLVFFVLLPSCSVRCVCVSSASAVVVLRCPDCLPVRLGVYSSMMGSAYSVVIRANLNSGFGSVVCCSVINLFSFLYCCMNRSSQQFMVILLLQCLSSLIVSVLGPYSWLLLSMCMAYADVVWLYLI